MKARTAQRENLKGPKNPGIQRMFRQSRRPDDSLGYHEVSAQRLNEALWLAQQAKGGGCARRDRRSELRNHRIQSTFVKPPAL